MTGARSPRTIVPALAVALLATLATLGVAASPAPAAPTHRAAVIVDTGGTVKRVVITFTEDSITGIQALDRAGMSPVVYQFGGQGGAVCRLLGVGRDAGPNCLGGGDGDPRYWSYHRAPAGTSSFKYSSVGAGAVQVRDGDVEGWKFGTGAAPQFVSLASLLPPPPPPTAPPATSPPATAAPTGGGVSPANPGAPTPNGPGAPTSASTLPATGGKDTPTSAKTGNDGDGDGTSDAASKDRSRTAGAEDSDDRTVDTALASSESDGGGGSAGGLILFAVLLAAVVAAILVVRRARKHAPAG
jgi:hypothetical protein